MKLQLQLAALALTGVMLGGCLNKSVVGIWKLQLWNLPMVMTLHDGRAQLTGLYKGAPLTVTGTYQQKDSDFSLNVSDPVVKHGNPFTSQMLNQEIQSVINPREFSGTLDMGDPDDFVFEVSNNGSDAKIHMKRQK